MFYLSLYYMYVPVCNIPKQVLTDSQMWEFQVSLNIGVQISQQLLIRALGYSSLSPHASFTNLSSERKGVNFDIFIYCMNALFDTVMV